jgi:hypothetical protein
MLFMAITLNSYPALKKVLIYCSWWEEVSLIEICDYNERFSSSPQRRDWRCSGRRNCGLRRKAHRLNVRGLDLLLARLRAI